MQDQDPFGTPREEDDSAELKSPEDAADRFGIRAAVLVTCVGFLIAAIWLVNSPSFQKCSAFENVRDRITCYEGVRSALLMPPAK
jgi:hypothetical protein